MIRDDLSDRLIHLTRGDTYDDAAKVFAKIVAEKRLVGSSGCIKGGFRCVCFSEAPLSKLTTILANPMAHNMRYKPFGVMVSKAWLFERGGRPAIYQSDAEFANLNSNQQWKHVRYEPPTVDFTWEREWRIQTDELPLSLEATTLIVPNREWESKFHDQHLAMLSRRAMVTAGFIGPSSVCGIPWHFVALEDLGVEIPDP